MKVDIGPFVEYFGPRKVAEKILFWKSNDSVAVDNLGERLAEWPWVTDFCFWFNGKRKRRVKIQVDEHDVHNADDTLALVIVAVLKKLREKETSLFVVKDESCPVSLTEPEDRWRWAIDEMIFAFECVTNDENLWCDNETRKRIDTGIRLFGKHFEALWEPERWPNGKQQEIER